MGARNLMARRIYFGSLLAERLGEGLDPSGKEGKVPYKTSPQKKPLKRVLEGGIPNGPLKNLTRGSVF